MKTSNTKQMPSDAVPLPQEVVSHILKFLPIPDIKSAAMVCRLWAKASDDPLLWKHTSAALYTKSKTFPDALIDSLQYRCIRHVRFVHMATSLQIIQVCKSLADNLDSICLQNCRCVSEELINIICNSCTKLRILDLGRCRQLDVTKNCTWINKCQKGFSSLTTLDVSWCKGLGDWMVETVAMTLPNISTLGIAGCKEVRLSTWQTLGENMKSLINLDISRSDISDASLLQFSQVPDLSLRVINLSACKQLSDNGIVALVKHQHRLQSLKLCCLDITNTSVVAIGKYLNDLQELDLNSCRQVTGGALCMTRGLTNTLTSLNLYSCYLLASKEMEKFFLQRPSLTTVLPLETLVLNGCNFVTDNFLRRCIPVLKNMQELDISSCMHVGDNGMDVITTMLTNLKVLKVSWCANITDAGLLGNSSSNNCKSENCLREKTRSSSIDNQNQSDCVLGIPLTGIANLQKLQALDVGHCTCLTDKGLSSIYGLNNLLSLNINMCIEITDVTLLNISKHLRSLKDLSFNGCTLITDTGLISVAQNLSHLASLDASKCDHITDLSVLYLAKHGTRLTHLDLSMCSHVTSYAIDELEANISGLVSLQLRYSGAMGSSYQCS